MRKTQILIAIVAATVFSTSIVAQAREPGSRDRAQIILAILQRADFSESETWRSDLAENTIYLLRDNVSIKQLPRIKGVRFVLVSRLQIEQMKEAGVEYYRFEGFQVRQSGVRVAFTREYVHQGKNSNGGTVIYTCRRTLKGWRLIPRLGPAWTAESH